MNARLNTIWLSQNPFVQIAGFVLGILLLIVAVLMGAIVFFVLLGIGAVLAVVIWLRLIWLRHKLKRDGPVGAGQAAADAFGRGRPQRKAGSGRIIDVEYTVVEEDDDRKGQG